MVALLAFVGAYLVVQPAAMAYVVDIYKWMIDISYTLTCCTRYFRCFYALPPRIIGDTEEKKGVYTAHLLVVTRVRDNIASQRINEVNAVSIKLHWDIIYISTYMLIIRRFR